MVKVRTHTFNKVNYDIDITEPLDGCCDYPRATRPSIRIAAEDGSKRQLITILHECLHAENWAISEEVVDRTSTEIGNLLWRLGYRKVD